ncbi:MAG TPA: lytic murein transglycosylase [Rhodocyclaceae bacterium]|nr:lytic murein transglycosylase [Rhodocyclaceae bacterium]
MKTFSLRQLALLATVSAAVLAPPAHAAPGFERCLADLRDAAAARGLARASFDRLTGGLEADMDVVALLDHQPEFRTPIWDYMAGLVDDERVADGRAMLEQWRDTLARIETAYGVDAETIVAIWGVESNYGRSFGKRPVVRSLATLSCFGRRQPFFRGEFLTTLQILEEGHVEPTALVGSWAGAFGHTQFMPSTFMRIAVDFDGDGRADLMGSVPDALASTANYLKRSGWRTNEPWGFEVRLPRGFDASGAGRRNKAALSDWAARGVRRVDGAPLAASGTPAGLLLPAGTDGPAFLVLRNFDALFSYNAAESYALAIAHLSDRLRGAGPFVTPWPTDDPGLSRAERRELQALLIGRGFDIGEVDGIIGTNTRRAIQDLQRMLGMEPDGRAGRRILDALRGG